MFDARFQLISEGTGDPELAGHASSDGSDPSFASALQFIDNPSDLVPLVYEGGLKTWECSLDLAGCLKRDGHAANAKGKRVLEVTLNATPPPLFFSIVDPNNLYSLAAARRSRHYVYFRKYLHRR